MSANKYVVVRANSTTGPYVVERNAAAPGVHSAACKADIVGYSETKREAEGMARRANAGECLSAACDGCMQCAEAAE